MRVMDEGLRPTERQLYDGIDTILRNSWQPFADTTPSQYRRGLDELFRFTLADNSFVAIAQYMCDLVAAGTGRQSSANDHLAVAEAIRKLKTRLIPEKWAAV